jgi:molecular chaperone DnaK
MNWEDYRKEIEARGSLPEEWYILGIDLGTTNSVISFWGSQSREPVPVDVSNGFGKIPLPSVVQYRACDSGEGEWIIGEEAYRSFKLYPESTVRSVKRKMGTDEKISLGGRDYLPEEISALILRELVGHVQNLNPKAEIAGLVVSVPYDFDDGAKKATMRAVDIAGLGDKLICLIEEPKAAALAYNFRRELSQDERILVFDFGGGTLDITLFHVTEKSDTSLRLQVISEGGEAIHGGDNVDEMLVERCFGYIRDRAGTAREDIAPENVAEIITRAREAKERLSGVKSFRIPFTFCVPPFVEQITREDFEKLAGNFIEKTRKLTVKALREAYTGAVPADMVDRVLLEGGSSQMPWVKNMLIGIFNDENKIYVSERPALDISLGATYYAAMKMGLLQNPDIETDRCSVEFLVTVPHDIGIELHGGGKKSFFPMIRRGTPYEFAKKSQVFTLSGDSPEDMTEFYLKILERIDKEHKLENCKLIGEVEISGLPERPNGKTRLKITLLVEEEGGLVKGNVEDLGFDNEFEPCGFNESFSPERYVKTKL